MLPLVGLSRLVGLGGGRGLGRVARSLNDARREAAELLERNTPQRDVEPDAVTWATAPGDYQKLRGVPCIGRVAGVVTDSTVPGSDEHLELWEGTG